MQAAQLGVEPFQSTRPVRGATHCIQSLFVSPSVSIHAPRAGRDFRLPPYPRRFEVSIHAPRAGRDGRVTYLKYEIVVSIHAPRAGRDLCRLLPCDTWDVSIHAPRAGRDSSLFPKQCSSNGFNPRAPCGARRQMRLHPPSFATYLWVLLATNMIFSAFCPTPLLRHGSHTYIFTPYFLFTSPSHSGRMLR